MIIYAIDDEEIALEGLLSALKKAAPQERVYGTTDVLEALKIAAQLTPDVVFLDIEMQEISGMEAARRFKEINPNLNIIFTTGYSQYAPEAFLLRASGYILKPVTADKVRQELENLRVREVPASKKAQEHPIRVRTFGNFEVYHGEEPIHFHYEKTKEMFAYLIDRKGAMCAIQEIIAVLWEDGPKYSHDSYFRNLKVDLIRTLKACGHEDIVLQKRGALGIRADGVSCDYFNLLESAGRDESADSLYLGEYMSQYSWAEITNSNLMSRFRAARTEKREQA